MANSPPNYLVAAFMMPANLLGLGAAAVASVATHGPLPALVGLGIEGLYLGVVSSARPFRRAVRARASQAERGDVGKLLEDLAPSQKEHYLTLCALRDKIQANYEKLPGGAVLVASSEQRMNALLTSFVRLVSTLNHYRKFLNATDRKTVERELAELQAELQADTSERLKEVKRRRIDILEKRLARFGQAEESRELVSHQLAGIEDLLKLTHEQSFAIRDPESVGPQLEALTAETQATEESVREMEKFLVLEEVTGPHFIHGTRVR